jgi:uncharacterized membrane protein YhhN
MFAWLAVGASGGVSLCATQMKKKRLAGFFKIFTIVLLIITLCVHGYTTGLSLSAKWVTVGLLLSLVGSLMFLFSNRFYPLAVLWFVLASLSYGDAFWLQLSGPQCYWIPSMLYAALVILLFVGLPSLSIILLPVIFQGIGMAQMTWAAAEVWIYYQSQAALLGFIGSSLLFSCCIGHAFRYRSQPVQNGSLTLNSLYFLSQALITASVLY